MNFSVLGPLGVPTVTSGCATTATHFNAVPDWLLYQQMAAQGLCQYPQQLPQYKPPKPEHNPLLLLDDEF